MRTALDYDARMNEAIQGELIDGVGVVRINRPDVLNVINLATLEQLVSTLERYDAEPAVRCLLLAGGERAFGSGADIAELAATSMVDTYQRDSGAAWERLRRVRKPIIVAVSGYAIGPACELLLAGDIVVASESTRISFPEVSMGALPGGGGTQRLARAVGKACVMDLLLTGRAITAREALAMGLVSRVVPREHYYEEALNICRELCKRPPLALQVAKQAVLTAYETTLTAGLGHERSLHYLLFGTADQREGLRAFLEQRAAVFVGR